MPENTQDQPSLEIVEPSALEALERAQIDIQISTAHKYPRASLSVIKQKIISFATLDEETAASCFYVLPRGGKEIRGPSVRLAEIALMCYGNISAGAREIGNDGKNITVQAATHDLENNVRIGIEVKRKITDKNGKIYNEDMQTTTGNAAHSIALRNAIFKVIPMALIKPAYDAARATAVGDIKTLGERRTAAMEFFLKTGVTKERVLSALGKDSIEDIDLATLETMQGIRTALKDGDTTIDRAFPELEKRAPKPSDPAKEKVVSGKETTLQKRSSNGLTKSEPEREATTASNTSPASQGISAEEGKQIEREEAERAIREQLADGDPEKALTLLMALDDITVDELKTAFLAFSIRIPRDFDGPGSLTKKTILETMEPKIWPMFVAHIKNKVRAQAAP